MTNKSGKDIDSMHRSSNLSSFMNEANHSSYNINLEHFTIIKVIGRGSFGKVYLVRKNDDN